MPHTDLPDLYFGGSNVLLVAFVLPIWLFKVLAVKFSAFIIASPLTWCCSWVETSISAVLNSQDTRERAVHVENTAEYVFAESIVSQLMSRVQAAASEVLMHAYANRRTGQIHIDMSEGNSGDSSRPAELTDDDIEGASHGDADRRRTEFSQLRQTISQSESAQTACTYFAALLPFVALFALKAFTENYGDIMRLLTGFLCFFACDQYIQIVVASGRPSFQQRITALAGVVIGLVGTSNIAAPVEDYNLWKVLLFRYAGEEYHSFTTTLLIIVLTDNFIKMITCVAKMLVVGTPCISSHQKRRNLQCIEYISQFYRCQVPTVQWITYFLGDGQQFYSSLNIGFAFAYFCLKLREGIIIGKVMVQSFRRVFETSNYGVTPTQAEIDETSMCSICHDRLSSPTKLSCSHMFCHSCIDTWLDKEHTCPMCRAVVDKKDNHYKSGATSKNIRFY